jgi:hypothetical protein
MTLALALVAWLATASGGSPAPETYCARLGEIRRIPFKGEPVQDEVYNGLKQAGAAALPCLIDRVTDVTRMPDPRRSMKLDDIAVGDLAVFLVWELGGLPGDKAFPPAIRKRYASEGVYAYFEYVEKPRNRKAMQRYLRSWWKQRSGGKGR